MEQAYQKARAHFDLRGLQNIILGPKEDLSTFETGARNDKGQAAFVMTPSSTEEVSALMAYCYRENIHIIPQSGNTGLVNGSIPDSSGLQAVMSLHRLKNPFILNSANRSLHVGAGMHLSDVNSRLASSHLCFPIDLGSDPMLGGMVATNTGGARFLRYGDVRQNLLGLKVVLADAQGTILDLTRALRKDNTSLDLKHLFAGTSGALGVITECVINLHPLTEQSAVALLVPKDETSILKILELAERSLGSQLSSFEFMSGDAMRAAIGHVPSLRNPFAQGVVPDMALLLEVSRNWPTYDGEIALDDLLTTVLQDIWEEETAPLNNVLLGRPEEVWALRHGLSEGIKHAGKLFAFDLAFERDVVMDFRRQLVKNISLRDPNLQVCDFGHIGDGGLHFNLILKNAQTYSDLNHYEDELRDWITEIAVINFKGSFSAEHGLGRKNQRYYDAYTPPHIKDISHNILLGLKAHPVGCVRLGPTDSKTT